MKKVLLTGATGLIGKEAIAPLKEAGFEVFAPDLDEFDMFDEKKLKSTFERLKPEYLLHFAWITSGDYLTSEINYKLRDASLKMLEVFKENGGKRAVFAGTCFEYKFKDSPLKEDDELNPETPYAKCKNELREKAQSAGVSFGWGRIFYVYGRGESETRLTPHIINSLKNDQKVVIKSGPLVKDYMFNKDIAAAFVKFLDSDAEGCVNICTGKGISIRDYVLKIASKLNKEHLIEFTDDCKNQPAFIVGDNSRLRNEVGYESHYDFEKSIKEILSES